MITLNNITWEMTGNGFSGLYSQGKVHSPKYTLFNLQFTIYNLQFTRTQSVSKTRLF
jgi:hypothetical protein